MPLINICILCFNMLVINKNISKKFELQDDRKLLVTHLLFQRVTKYFVHVLNKHLKEQYVLYYCKQIQ